MISKKFEARFDGPANKGLRARIRRVTKRYYSNPARASAIRALAGKVALNARGLATLELVARDYDPRP